jgi:hypothetical protein
MDQNNILYIKTSETNAGIRQARICNIFALILLSNTQSSAMLGKSISWF